MVLDTLGKFKVLKDCKVNNTTFTITLANGSAFLFKGMDDSEKIKSVAGITDIIVEEATEISQDEFTQLDLRLRANAANLQMFLMFNPVSKVNWCYKHWFENGTPENTKIIKSTYKDNRFLPPDYVASLENMKQTNYTYWNIYANGEFCSLDKLIFTNWRQYDGEVPHGIYGVNEIDFYEPNSSGYIPTNITAKTVGTNDAFMSKIDLTRGCKYSKDSAGNLYISEFIDSEGGLIKFPFINGMKDSTTDTLHTPSGGAYCVGFSEYDFTSGGTSVRLPCLVIYWYLNGRWRPKYRFRLSDIAGYDNSGNLTGWVPNTTK